MTNMPYSPQRNQFYLEIEPLVAECTEEERILRNSRIILSHPSCYKNNNNDTAIAITVVKITVTITITETKTIS